MFAKNFFKKAVLATLAVAGVLLAPCSVGATVLNKPQMDEVLCAGKKMQLFYYYLTVPRDPQVDNYGMECRGTKFQIAAPKWLNEQVPPMAARKVWRDPAEGDLSEAQVWQAPIAILYEFFEYTKKTFPVEYKGSAIPPGLLVKEYSDIKVRYQMSLDRVYRARLASSMQGRGRAVLSYLDLINKEMDALMDAIGRADSASYTKVVMAISSLSQDAFAQMLPAEPRRTDKNPKPGALDQILPNLFKIAGLLLVFFGIRHYLGGDEERFGHMIADYVVKTKQWKEAYDRQFIQIKVQYLVFVPIGLFMLAGMLTFSFWGFLILSFMGIYVGLKTPMKVLNYLKQRRGHQVDVQLMDALILLSNSLKSGMDIVQGFDLVSKDLIPPISEEFGLVLKNYRLGTPFERALEGMEERVASRLLAYMIRAIVLQRQVGGNLTKIFERILENIREESKLEEKTKALTAQQKIQSIVVGLMPWVMLLVLFLFQGEIMAKFYFQPIGMMVLLFCGVWIAIGMKVVQSLGNIRV